jgi:hypothetical protein
MEETYHLKAALRHFKLRLRKTKALPFFLLPIAPKWCGNPIPGERRDAISFAAANGGLEKFADSDADE